MDPNGATVHLPHPVDKQHPDIKKFIAPLGAGSK
jgi:hypothetical protein